MKYRSLLLAIVIVVTTNLSGDICWNEGGALVYKSNNLSWGDGLQALSDGDFLMVWSDAISERQQVKAMKIQSDGAYAWNEPVILNGGYSILPYFITTREVAEGVIVCWLETGDIIQVHCQKIDPGGNKLWGEEGLSFEVDAEDSYNSQLWIIEGNDGGAFIAWYVPQELCGIYLDSEGNTCPGWSEGGDVILTDLEESPVSIISDGFGGLVIAWMNHDSGYGIFQRCTSAGEFLWGDNGIELPFDVESWQIFLNEPGEYYILYNEEHNFLLTGLDDAGQLLFTEPESVFSIPEEAGNYFSGEPASDGGYIFVWSEGNLARAQKIMLGEEPLWGEDGIIIGDNISNYSVFYTDPDNNGGLYVSWHYVFANAPWCSFQHINSEGDVLLGDNGYEVDIKGSRYNSHRICVQEDDSAGFFWADSTETQNIIKLQTVTSEGEILLEPEGCVVYSLDEQDFDAEEMVCCEDYTAVIWEVTIGERREIHCQILENENGNRLFAELGLPLLYESSMKYSIRDCAFNLEEDLLYVAFNVSTSNNQNHNSGIQAVDLNGNLMFGEGGLLISNWGEGYEYDCMLFRPEADGMGLIWNEPDNEVIEEAVWRMQKLNSQGFMWQETVSICEATTDNYTDKFLDGDFLVWEYEDRIRAVKFDGMGNIAPGWNGNYLQTAEIDTNHEFFAQATDTGIIILIEIHDMGIYSIYGYNISNEGEFLWGTDGRLLYESDDPMSIAMDNECFYVDRAGNDNYERLLDKMNYEGETMWDESLMWTETQRTIRRHLIADDDKIYLFYTLQTGNGYRYLVAFKGFDADGQLLEGIPDEGLIICNDYSGQTLGAVESAEENNFVVLWGDSRSQALDSFQSSYYAQKLDFTSVGNNKDDLINQYVSLSNYPNPFNPETTISFFTTASLRGTTTRQAEAAENTELVIYNIKGQKVRGFREDETGNSELGIRKVVWNGRDDLGRAVASGIYLVRLRAGDESSSRKILLLK